jgi:hypothetical protein
MLLARLIQKAIPSQTEDQIIRAMSFFTNRSEQGKKPTYRLTAASLPQFRYRWIVITYEPVAKLPKNPWHF